MHPTRDEIKAWLKNHQRSRAWLGEQCGGTHKRTVDNWLSASQDIPAGTLSLIGRLMMDDRAAEAAGRRAGGERDRTAQVFSVEVDLDTFRGYNRAALAKGLTIEEWIIRTCDDEVERMAPGVRNVVAMTAVREGKGVDQKGEHRTSNVQHRTSKGKAAGAAAEDGHWLDLLGGIAAGAPISAAVEAGPVRTAKAYPADHYALKVCGRSMEPKIADGAVIVVKRFQDQGLPKKGSIVVYNDGHGATLKELAYRKAKPGEEANNFGQVPVLRSLNKEFPEVQVMEGGRVDGVFVEGF